MTIKGAFDCAQPAQCVTNESAPSTELTEVALQQGSVTGPTAVTASACTGGEMRMRRPSLFSTVRRGMAALAFGSLLLAHPDARAQVGLFDPSWRPGGRTVIPTPGTIATLAFIRAAGSRWMIGGECEGTAGDRGCALRLMANGDVDTSYGDPFQGNAALSDLAGLQGGGVYIAQSDAAGRVWFARNGGGAISVGRVNAAGTAATNPPLSFHYLGTADLPSSFASAVVVAPDGSAYVIGSARAGVNDTDFGIARLTPELQLDPAFNGSGVRTIAFGLFDNANAAVLQTDGRLLVAGSSQDGVGGGVVWVVRLLNDGSLDPSFGIGGRVRLVAARGAEVGGVAVDTLGRVLIAGSQQFTMVDSDGYVIRLTPEGFFDTNFGDAGGAALGFNLVPGGADFLNAVVVQPDGKIIVGGFAQGVGRGFFVSARITDSGVYDASYGAGGVSLGTFGPVPIPSNTSDELVAMTLDDQGRLMIAGHYVQESTRRFGVGRIVTGVVIDPIFANGFE